MPFSDYEWLAALAYPVGVLISAALAKKTSKPTVAAATITELREQILANANLLYPTTKQPAIPSLAIALLFDDTTDPQPENASSVAKNTPSFRAALLLVASVNDEASEEGELPNTTRTLLQGGPGRNLGEAFEALLATTATALKERIRDRPRGRARKRD